MRLTPQRLIILGRVGKGDFPSHSQLKFMIWFPGDCLVSALEPNLELMADSGIILKLQSPVSKAFRCYRKTRNHIRCRACGKVNDIEIAVQGTNQ